MSKTILNLNVSSVDFETNDVLSIWNYYNKRPNTTVIHQQYKTSLFLSKTEHLYEDINTFSEISPLEDSEIINYKKCIRIANDIFISYFINDLNSEESNITDLTFYYKNDDDIKHIEDFLELIDDAIFDDFEEEEMDKTKTFNFQFGQHGLVKSPVFKKVDIDNYDLFYNTDTFKDIEKSIKKIKKNKKGLTIYYGERGVGKTSIIDYLSEKINKDIIYISNPMVEHTFNNPDFISILRMNRNSVLVLDDCEMLFNEVFNKTNNLIVNLLQIIDGWLSDSMNINIVLLFNVDDENDIDHNLLECNNLLDVVKFDYLEIDEIKELKKHLGINKKYKSKGRLIDIINKRSSDQETTIGF